MKSKGVVTIIIFHVHTKLLPRDVNWTLEQDFTVGCRWNHGPTPHCPNEATLLRSEFQALVHVNY